MQNIKRTIICIISVILVFYVKPVVSNADVGSFDSYDSDWGSSWDSGWSDSWGDSWGSDSWSDDWDSDTSWSDSNNRKRKIPSWSITGNKGADSALAILLVVAIYFLVRLYIIPRMKKFLHYVETKDEREKVRSSYEVYDDMIVDPEIYQGPIAEKVKEIDELFDKERFNKEAKQLFIKMQKAWTERNWQGIREFETDELYEQHKMQIEGYINSNTINILDNINVYYSKLYSFKQNGDKDVLNVVIKSTMVDYIIDATSGKVVKGNKDKVKERFYKLEFIRKAGVKTNPKSAILNNMHCPNCGAPIKINTIGECDYCGSTITNGDFGWILNNYEPFKQIYR